MVHESQTKRHWRVLRNALVSHTRDNELDVTSSSVSTEFFPQFTSRLAYQGVNLPEAEPNFEWRIYTLHTDKSIDVVVHEKKKRQKVSLDELFSHELNDGVDNTGNIRTWPSEPILLSYLLRTRVCEILSESQSARIRICELGSGMAGLVSLGLLVHSSKYIEELHITDGNPQSVHNLQRCVEGNQLMHNNLMLSTVRVTPQLLRWDRNVVFNDNQRHQFDLVVASDCLFFEEFHIDLAHTINELLKPGTGRCLLLQPRRNGSMERFLQVATDEYKLDVEIVHDYDDTVRKNHLRYQQTREDYNPDVHLPILISLRSTTTLLPPPDLLQENRMN